VTKVPIENIEKKEIVGGVTDADYYSKTDEFENFVRDLLDKTNGSLSTLVFSKEVEDKAIKHYESNKVRGEIGFGYSLVENLDYPYSLLDAEDKDLLTKPTVPEDS